MFVWTVIARLGFEQAHEHLYSKGCEYFVSIYLEIVLFV